MTSRVKYDFKFAKFESAYYFKYESVHIVDIEQIKDSVGWQFY